MGTSKISYKSNQSFNPLFTTAPPCPQKDTLNLDQDSLRLPGLTHIFSAPKKIFNAVKETYKAHRIGDAEGIFENALRTVQSPIILGHSIVQIVWNSLFFGVFMRIFNNAVLRSVSTLGGLIPIAGLTICGIEGLLETTRLLKSLTLIH
jgi:hypothetical protein